MAAADYMVWDEMKKLVEELNRELKSEIRAPGFKPKPSSGRLSLFINLGCHTALRVSDLLRLSWDAVLTNGSCRKVLVLKEKKTGKTRKIPLHEDVRKHVNWYYKNFGSPGYVFKNRNGDPVSDTFMRAEMTRLKKRKKIRVNNFSTHTLRKTWAHHVWEKAEGDAMVFEMMSMALNHSSTKMTRIYLGITDKEISKLYLTV